VKRLLKPRRRNQRPKFTPSEGKVSKQEFWGELGRASFVQPPAMRCSGSEKWTLAIPSGRGNQGVERKERVVGKQPRAKWE
jgi:hypothetical protein